MFDFRTFLEVFTDKELEDYCQILIDCLDKPELDKFRDVQTAIYHLRTIKTNKYFIDNRQKPVHRYLEIRKILRDLINFSRFGGTHVRHSPEKETIRDAINCFKEKMNHPMLNLDSPDFSVAIDRLDDKEDIEYNTIKLLVDKIKPFIDYFWSIRRYRYTFVPEQVIHTMVRILAVFSKLEMAQNRSEVNPILAELKVELEDLEEYIDGLLKIPLGPDDYYPIQGSDPYPPVGAIYAPNITRFNPQNVKRAITLLKRIIDNPNVRRL